MTTNNVIHVEFSPADILEWLESKPEDEIIHSSKVDMCTSCLFANYLQERYEDETISLGYSLADSAKNASVRYKIPKWATSLIPTVDRLGDSRENQSLTVADAKLLMENTNA